MTTCDHKFVYGGVKYKDEGQRSGSSALDRHYYDWFYCEKCSQYQFKQLNVPGAHSYQEILFNATAMPCDRK